MCDRSYQRTLAQRPKTKNSLTSSTGSTKTSTTSDTMSVNTSDVGGRLMLQLGEPGEGYGSHEHLVEPATSCEGAAKHSCDVV